MRCVAFPLELFIQQDCIKFWVIDQIRGNLEEYLTSPKLINWVAYYNILRR